MRLSQIMIAAAIIGGMSIAPAAGAQAPAGGACGFLTQAQVGAALGVPVEPGQERAGSYPRSSACLWRSTNGVFAVGFEPMTPIQFRGTKMPNAQISVPPVSGLGDEGHFRESNVKIGNFSVQLYVKKGTTAVLSAGSQDK